MTEISNKKHIYSILIFSIIFIAIVFSFPPIAQDHEYHNFADKKPFVSLGAEFSFSNFADVVSNLPFAIFGLIGLVSICSCQERCKEIFAAKGENVLWNVFFLGAFFVSLGSGYYHLDPNNHTLVWDRLPMTIAFMSLFSVMIVERISYKAGMILFPVFLMLGILSVFYWDYTESVGRGDLRPYVIVQFLPMVIIPFMLVVFKAKYAGTRYIVFALLWYLLAKIFEFYDVAIYEMTNEIVSGHSIKHIATAIGVYSFIEYLKVRGKK